MPLLFQKCVVDDAFFYLGIAKNIALGNGATFDGSIMTNGFHPVFAILLVPIFWIFPGNMEIPLHFALTILSVFNLLTGLVIYYIAREIAGKFAGLFALFFWLFNPYVIMIALSGVEVAVACFFLSLCILQYIRLQKSGFSAPKQIIMLGIITALGILSRVDVVFMMITINLFMFYLEYKKKKSFFKALYLPTLYSCVVFAILTPWFFWNLYNFGTIRQISGVTLPNIAHNMYLMKYKTYLSLYFLKTEIFNLKVWITHIIKYSGGISLFIILAGFFILIVRKRVVRALKELLVELRILFFAILSVIFLVSFYALYFWGWLRPWYYLSVILVVTICLGITAGYIQKSFFSAQQKPFKQIVSIVIFFCILTGYFSYQGLYTWKKGLFPFQKQLYDSAIWLKDNTESNSKIGAISAGIYGHLTQRTIDLAGVVNQEAYQAMREKRIFLYLKEKGIKYLVDRKDMIQFYNARFDTTGSLKDFKVIKRFGEKVSDIVVYKIIY